LLPAVCLSLVSSSSSAFVHLRDPLSFPTRRSSDLLNQFGDPSHGFVENYTYVFVQSDLQYLLRISWFHHIQLVLPAGIYHKFARSEEHTSELQSRFDLVCRLLLEKKNQGVAWSTRR